MNPCATMPKTRTSRNRTAIARPSARGDHSVDFSMATGMLSGSETGLPVSYGVPIREGPGTGFRQPSAANIFHGKKMRVPVTGDRIPKSIAPLSPAIRDGEVIYLSGQIGLDPATGKLVPGDVATHARQ